MPAQAGIQPLMRTLKALGTRFRGYDTIGIFYGSCESMRMKAMRQGSVPRLTQA